MNMFTFQIASVIAIIRIKFHISWVLIGYINNKRKMILLFWGFILEEYSGSASFNMLWSVGVYISYKSQ